MILPDDVIPLILAYSRPLKRRVVSDYWNNPNITTDSDMIENIITHMSCIIETHGWFAECRIRLDIVYIDGTITINIWAIEDEYEYLEWKVRLEMYHVLNWKQHDELYHVGLTPIWITPQHFITQLINDNGKIVNLL